MGDNKKFNCSKMTQTYCICGLKMNLKKKKVTQEVKSSKVAIF